MAQSIQIDKSTREILDKYCQTISQDANLAVEQIYLFGSHAKGTTRKDSDIDIAVISDQSSANSHNYRLNLLRKRKGISYSIEPHPLTQQDLNNQYHPLAQAIRDHGIRLL